MTTYDFIQVTISSLRDNLKDTPLTAGEVVIDKLYREFDKKLEENNYISMGYMDLYSQQTTKGDTASIRIFFDVFSTNEIMCARIADKFKKEYLDGLRVGAEEIPLKSWFDMGINKLDTNKYVRRISCDVDISYCWSI
jgi:hypothetical protein